jgi:sugar/nucleoside kinase (ribokinase family)
MHETKLLNYPIEHLLNWLEVRKLRKFSVVTMPDLFFDRFISYEESIGKFSKEALEVVHRKGGSIDNVKQIDFRGGNAANTAAALATLGVSVSPIIETDNCGYALLKHSLEPLCVNLNHVKTKGRTPITTALEFKQNNNKVNLMLRDLGSLADFGPKNLTPKDYELLATADYVCVFNWAGTRQHGTELAETVFRHVKTRGKGKTYYDTADPTPNKNKISRLIEKVLSKDLVDILSVNENEAVQYATYINPKQAARLKTKNRKLENLAIKCAAILSNSCSARIDLHTTAYSATFNKNKKPTIAPSFKTKVFQATGAGDAWNAGNIYATAQGMSDKMRLTFANAVAAYYISNSEAAHPSVSQLRNFLKRYCH